MSVTRLGDGTGAPPHHRRSSSRRKGMFFPYRLHGGSIRLVDSRILSMAQLTFPLWKKISQETRSINLA